MQGEDLTELNNEQGGHRVQRIPPTERKGRVHSSTVTVAVLAEVRTPQVVFSERDFKIEWYSGTGSGGQHRNKHQNSCRIMHLKTGLISTAQCRSRENSFEEAKTTILKRLNELSSKAISSSQAQNRKSQVGSGERGDKRRTYRFQDDQAFDSVTEKRCSLKKVMAGHFDLLW